ncbi:MAG: heme-binding domain-containing protein [Anaerolineae bacterium]|nr:heme-binding domain-containing protein [Anaerolineae bacterium]
MSRRRKVLLGIVAVIVIAFIGLQLIPPEKVFSDYKFPGNPPVDAQFQWDSPQTEQLARSACYDCHSNETRYPWYSHVAPVSWLIYDDINVARDSLNFSTWSKREIDVNDIIDQIQQGAMPLPIYLPLHSEAQLTAEQKAQLIAGLQATFGS